MRGNKTDGEIGNSSVAAKITKAQRNNRCYALERESHCERTSEVYRRRAQRRAKHHTTLPALRHLPQNRLQVDGALSASRTRRTGRPRTPAPKLRARHARAHCAGNPEAALPASH